VAVLEASFQHIESKTVFCIVKKSAVWKVKSCMLKEFTKYYKRWKAEEITAVEFAKLLKVGRATLYRYIKEYDS
jgi:hypothetical protein